MPFGNKAEPTIVRKVKVRHDTNMKKEQKQLRLSPMKVVRDQLFLANRYKHLVIDALLAGRNAYRKMRVERYPAYQALDVEVERFKVAIEEIDDQVRKSKAKANRKGVKFVKDAALAEEKKRLIEAKKRPQNELKAMRLAVKSDEALASHSNAVQTPILKAAKEWANKPTDRDGKPYPLALYQATQRKALEAVQQGAEKAEPEHKAWKGGGRLAVQLQHPKEVKEKYPATWENVKNGVGPWPSLLQIHEVPRKTHDGKDGKPLTVFRVRLASDQRGKPIFVDCPCVLDEGWMWPEDAYCTWVYLTCRPNGRDFVYSLSFHLARTAGWEKEDRAEEGTVAVYPGYRKVDEGIRVATWVGDDGEMGHLVIPMRSKVADHAESHRRVGVRGVEYADHVETLLAERDFFFNMLKDKLQRYFFEGEGLISAKVVPVKEWLEGVLQAEKLTKKRVGSKTILLKLLGQCRGEFPAELQSDIDHWARKEIRLERWQTKQAAKWERHRLSRYRSFWAGLRRKYRHIVLPDINWAEMRRNPPPEEKKEPAMVRFRNIAAPGELAALALNPTKVSAENVSCTCSECGTICSLERGEVLFECDGCGKILDKDVNAAYNCLARGQVDET